MLYSKHALLFTTLLLTCSSVLADFVSFQGRATTGPAQKACKLIESQVGDGKVVYRFKGTNTTSYYYSRTHYYTAFNGDNFPACVLLPTTTKDVARAIKAVRHYNARFAVKAGGHNTNMGWSSTTGVLIDLRNMTKISVNKSAHTATYQPGRRWGEIYPFVQQYGQMVVGGRLGDVGTGLSLGGGLSYLSAQYGLSCDGFLSLEVVLPSGDIVTATGSNKYSDLFWGLKGGGNSLGVVTQYTVKTHDIGNFYAGLITYSASHQDEILKATHEFIVNNKDPKAAIIVTRETILTQPLDVYLILAAYDGEDPGDAYKMFDAIPNIGDTRKVKTYVETTEEADIPIYGFNQLYRAASYAPSLDALKNLTSAFKAFTAKNSLLNYQLTSLDIQPVPQSLIDQSRKAGGNALQSPDGPYFWVNALIQTDHTLNPKVFYESFKKRFEEFYPPSTAGLPLFLNDAQDDQPILQSYGGFSKLKKVKAKYDPDNFFSTYQQGPSYS